MRKNEAVQLASAYAWGREDASGIRTACDGSDDTGVSGTYLFSQAFAQGCEDYDDERRSTMIPVRDAYDQWQASEGRSIFAPDQTTEACQARTAEHRAAMNRPAMSDEEWEALAAERGYGFYKD